MCNKLFRQSHSIHRPIANKLIHRPKENQKEIPQGNPKGRHRPKEKLKARVAFPGGALSQITTRREKYG
jgi:hypothetical protein